MGKRSREAAAAAESKQVPAPETGAASKRRRTDDEAQSTDDAQSKQVVSSTDEVEAKALRKAARQAARKAEEATAQADEEQSHHDTATTSIPEAASVDQTLEKASEKQSKDKKKKNKTKHDSENVTISNGTSHTAVTNDVNGHATVSSGSAASSGPYQQDSALSKVSQSDIDDFLKRHFIAITDPRSTDYRPIIGFKYLPDHQSLTSVFGDFKSPTPIQAAAWPFLLAGRDTVGVAETGSGKTLAFGVPCIRHVLGKSGGKNVRASPRGLILSPTRELALQIYEQLDKVTKGSKLSVQCVYGGVPKDEQRKALANVDIVVATPGRLNDFVQEGSLDLGRVSYLVLDEADRMLDKGFEDDIRRIVGATPSQNRQTCMFTATWPTSVRELAATFTKDPVKITIGDNPTGELRANTRITQKVEVVDPRGKETRLLQLLKQYQSGANKNDRILVFCLYKKEATRIENFIRSKGFRVAGIHGDMSQPQRTASLELFKSGKTPLLVATDVAARGLGKIWAMIWRISTH